MGSLAPQDATRYWLGRRGCTDLFLLYCFDDAGAAGDRVRDQLIERARRIPDLCVRIQPRTVAYPGLLPYSADGSEAVEISLAEPFWAEVLGAVGNLLGTKVDPDISPWRIHVFRNIAGAPGGGLPALVAVLQISHALVDGQRAAGVARALFGAEPDSAGAPTRRAVLRDDIVGRLGAEGVAIATFPVRMLRTVVRGLRAERARRELAVLTAAGELPPPPAGVPATVVNRPPIPVRHAVALTVRRDLRVPGHTVTAVVLTAVSVALTEQLAALGAPAGVLAAQVSMAVPPAADRSRNNYRDLSVELHTGEPDLRRRAELITTTVSERRRRATHLLQDAQAHVTAVLPAPILRRDIAAHALDQVPDVLAGNTVVSSVYRGPADLSCAGGRVRFTGGFPAVGAVMHLTHGIHGLGDTVTVSVHADPEVLPDVDGYLHRLDTALDAVVRALAATA